MKFGRRQRVTLALIILAYLGLGITYALATPPLESSDEFKHYPFVQYVQQQRKLPVLDPQNPGLWLQEAGQPPLYYLVMATLTSGIDTTDMPGVHQLNPQAFIGNPGQVGNKNLIIHDPVRETFPWQGTILAIYVIRLATLLLGVGTILVVATLGQQMFTPTVALLAAALTAFNPMFLFVSSAVNNDALAIFMGNLGLLLLVGLWRDTPDPRRSWGRYVLLGIVLGLGMLTKLSLGGLLGLTGLTLAWQAWRRKSWRLLFGGGMLVLATAVLICGWWFVRNWQIYGDITGLNVFVAVQGTRAVPLNLAGWLDEFGTFYHTYWGLFGAINIAAPLIFYQLLNLFVLIGAIGLGKWLLSKVNRAQFASAGGWLLVVWIGVLFLLLIRWNIIYTSFQGRLIFPSLGAINVLWAMGLLALLRASWQPKAAALFGGALFVTAALLPWLTIRPVYALPQPVTAVPTAHKLQEPLTFTADDGQMRLVGVDMAPNQTVLPGENPVVVTLYWQMDEPVAADYISSVHLLGRELNSVAQIDRYPALGMIPTSRWQAGDIFVDEYHVTVDETAVAPAQLHVAVSLYNADADATLPVTNPNGLPIDPLFVGEVARLTHVEWEIPSLDQAQMVPFEQGITLLGLAGTSGAAGETVPLTFYWQANATPNSDYTVFVQLLDQDGNWLAGADAPPANNFYPTSLWQEGDIVDDQHWLPIPADLPPGDYRLVVGLYDPINGPRLLRSDGRSDFAEFLLSVE